MDFGQLVQHDMTSCQQLEENSCEVLGSAFQESKHHPFAMTFTFISGPIHLRGGIFRNFTSDNFNATQPQDKMSLKRGNKLFLDWKRNLAETLSLQTSARQQLRINKLKHILKSGGQRVGSHGVERHCGKCSKTLTEGDEREAEGKRIQERSE